MCLAPSSQASFEERFQRRDDSVRPEGHDLEVGDADAGRGQPRLRFLQSSPIVHQRIGRPAWRGGEQPESDLLEPARGRDFDELRRREFERGQRGKGKRRHRISCLLMVILQGICITS